MVEYAIKFKFANSKLATQMHCSGETVDTNTITSDLNEAKNSLEKTLDDIKQSNAHHSADEHLHENATLVMREVTPWCEMNTKPIDYKWNGKAIA